MPDAAMIDVLRVERLIGVEVSRFDVTGADHAGGDCRSGVSNTLSRHAERESSLQREGVGQDDRQGRPSPASGVMRARHRASLARRDGEAQQTSIRAAVEARRRAKAATLPSTAGSRSPSRAPPSDAAERAGTRATGHEATPGAGILNWTGGQS